MAFVSKESKPAVDNKPVPLWDAQGKMRLYHSIDVKEILAMPDCQYSKTPPTKDWELKEKELKEVEKELAEKEPVELIEPLELPIEDKKKKDK